MGWPPFSFYWPDSYIYYYFQANGIQDRYKVAFEMGKFRLD